MVWFNSKLYNWRKISIDEAVLEVYNYMVKIMLNSGQVLCEVTLLTRI
jgi:hypothetical protein